MKITKPARKVLPFLIATIMAVTIFAACSEVSTINPERLKIDKAYKFTAIVQYGNENAATTAKQESANNVAGVFERKNEGVWSVTLTEPYALEGIVMTYDNGEITAIFENMQSIVYSELSVVEHIVASFENAIGGEGREVISHKDVITITSRAGSPAFAYELVLDKSDLEPISLRIKDRALSAEFSDVQASQVIRVFPNF